MSKAIHDAKKISDSLRQNKSIISKNIKEVIMSINKHNEGVIIEIPWQTEVDGEFIESVTVLAVKVSKDRIYFINPVKVSLIPCEITKENKKGPPRIIEKDGLESMSLIDFVSLTKKKPVYGIIREAN